MGSCRACGLHPLSAWPGCLHLQFCWLGPQLQCGGAVHGHRAQDSNTATCMPLNGTHCGCGCDCGCNCGCTVAATFSANADTHIVFAGGYLLQIELRPAALVAPAGINKTSIQQLLKQQQAQQAQDTTGLQQQRRSLLGRQAPQQQQEQEQQQQPQQPAAGNVTVVAPTRGMWGTASIGGRSIYLALSSGGAFHKVLDVCL